MRNKMMVPRKNIEILYIYIYDRIMYIYKKFYSRVTCFFFLYIYMHKKTNIYIERVIEVSERAFRKANSTINMYTHMNRYTGIHVHT